MQEAVPLGKGGMVAILGLSSELVSNMCLMLAEEGYLIDVANFNCPGQVVIAGERQALERAVEEAKKIGAKKCVNLPVSAPFHSRLMRPAADRLAVYLAAATLRDPEVPVVANVTADFVREGEKIKELLKEQIYSPVLWEQSVNRLVNDGMDVLLEVGPGNVLTGLNKKITRRTLLGNVEDPESLEKMLARLLEVS